MRLGPPNRDTGLCVCADNYLDWGPHNPENIRSQYHINPCMSTGFWFIQPTKASREFLAGFLDLMLYWRNHQVDQVLWNEVSPVPLLSLQTIAVDVRSMQDWAKLRRQQMKEADCISGMHCFATSGWYTNKPILEETQGMETAINGNSRTLKNLPPKSTSIRGMLFRGCLFGISVQSSKFRY